MNKKQLRTPLIKPRKQGGTFYTFGSALEDIGLNINELNNKVVLSHYVLLDLPAFDNSTFNTVQTYDNPDYIFAEGFQDYVLNMEATVRNHMKYDFTNSLTVSERIFWKWLKPLMQLDASTSNGVTRYIDNKSIAKCFGYINSGAQRSDDYSMYNETFVQVPSSFSQMRVLYKVTEDDNYYADSSYISSSSDGYIENIDVEAEVTNDVLNKTGISALGIFDDPDNHAYIVNEDSDLLTVDFSLDSLRRFYGDELITFDDLAIKNANEEETDYTLSDEFDFNAALIYYSIYDSTGKNILATNAYGLLLFNNSEPVNASEELEPDLEQNLYKFGTLNKRASTPTMSGTSYSFRLNIKASSVYSGDILVADNATPAYSMSTDFNDTVKNLYTAINILKSNANLTAAINSEYRNLKNLTIEAIEKADQAEKEVSELKNGRFKVLDSSNLHTNTLVVGNGIDIAEGGSLQNQGDSGVLMTIGAIDSSYINTHYENTDALRVDTVLVPNAGVTFSDEESQDELAKIDKEGLSARNLMITQDFNTSSYTPVLTNHDDIINQVFEYIMVRRNQSTGELFIYIQGGAQGEVGDILAKLYDEETKRLDLKQILALLIAKIKLSDNE